MPVFVHSNSTKSDIGNGLFYKKTFSPDQLKYYVLPVVTVFVVAVVYFVNVPALKANTTLIKAISSQGGDISKNLALYGERVGSLQILCASQKEKDIV